MTPARAALSCLGGRLLSAEIRNSLGLSFLLTAHSAIPPVRVTL